MAINELSTEIEKEQVERAKRYPLLDIQNNREEIRTIAQETIKYAAELYPRLEGIEYWEIIARTAIEFMNQYIKLANSKKSTKNCVMIPMGEFMSVGVEYGETADSDKDGTYNPIITIGPELAYDNENPENNKLRKNPPVFNEDDEQNIDFICKSTQNVCKSKYTIIFEDHKDIARLTFAFFRQIRQYLIDHKDDESTSDFDYGLDIDLGNVLDIGICKYDVDGVVNYAIQFSPGQSLKVLVKDDEDTETKND